MNPATGFSESPVQSQPDAGVERPPLHLDERLLQLAPPVDLPAGTVIFAAGSQLRCALLVRSGQVRVELAHPDLSQPLLMRSCGPGAIVAPSGLAQNPVHHCQVVASTRVQAFLISHATLDNLGRVAPATALALTSLLLAQANTELAGCQLSHLEERLLSEPDSHDERILAAARDAQRVLATWDEERIDQLIAAIRQAVTERAEHFAQCEHEQGGMGNVPDKLHKLQTANARMKTRLTGLRSVGKIREDIARGSAEYGTPVGVVFAVVPPGNAIPTALSQLLTAIKTRNAIVFSYPAPLLAVGAELTALVQQVLRAAQAPSSCVQHLGRRAGRLRLGRLMSHPGVDLILASGSAGLLKAANSSGKPVFGSGPANVLVLVAADADLERAAQQTVSSKNYDHGLGSAAESDVVVERSVHQRFASALTRQGALVLSVEQTDQAIFAWFDPKTSQLRHGLLGQPAQRLAELARLDAPAGLRLIVMTVEERHLALLGAERLAPLLTLFVEDAERCVARCKQLAARQTRHHSAVIHSHNTALIEQFLVAIPSEHLLVNCGLSELSLDARVRLEPGAEALGRAPTADDLDWRQLINVQRVTHSTNEPAQPGKY